MVCVKGVGVWVCVHENALHSNMCSLMSCLFWALAVKCPLVQCSSLYTLKHQPLGTLFYVSGTQDIVFGEVDR